jgi:hypothetical protein
MHMVRSDELPSVMSDRCPVTQWAASNYNRKDSRQEGKARYRLQKSSTSWAAQANALAHYSDTENQSRGMAGQDNRELEPRTDLSYSRGVQYDVAQSPNSKI